MMLTANAGNYTLHTWNFGGLSREYYLYVPNSYDSTKPTPFVLVLHGLGDTISNFIGINMNLVADTGNFIFAVPQAINDPLLGASAWNSGAGEFGITLNSNVDDVGFLNALIDSTASHYNIDQTRLYSTGFSMGGFMTNRLGCELNNRIAAIASVSGTIGNYVTCNPSRAVPACHFHGTADQTVNYTGNPFGNDAEALVAYWRTHDHCDTTPAYIDTLPQHVNDGRTFVHYKYANGNYGTEVEFYKVINGVHEWIVDANINYSVAIWQFFYRFKWTEQTNGVNEVQAAANLKVYPNPANDVLSIELTPTNESQSEITVTDLTGRMIYKAELNNTQTNLQLNTKKWVSGSYIYNLGSAKSGVIARGKFVVTH